MNKDERINKYNELFSGLSNVMSVEDLDYLGFFTAPASTRFHGAYEGGLFDHSLAVTESLVELTEKLGLTWERSESPYIVGMYHDLCKCNCYDWDIESGRYIYNSDLVIPGHGARSLIIAQQFINLTEEELTCIRWHMGAYEKDTSMWDYYGRAIEKYPNVLYTHTADMIASKIRGI